jgi:hypothetical protein
LASQRGARPRTVAPRRCQTALRGRPGATSVTTDCHSQRATPQKPLRSAGPAALVVELDPRRVTAPIRAPAGESRPPSGERPGQNRIGSVLLRLGRRAASVDASVRPWVSTGVRRRGQSKGNGVRACAAARRPRGRAPPSRTRLVQRGRPQRPSSAGSSPRRSGVRGSRRHVCSLPGVLLLFHSRSDSAVSLAQ